MKLAQQKSLAKHLHALTELGRAKKEKTTADQNVEKAKIALKKAELLAKTNNQIYEDRNNKFH